MAEENRIVEIAKQLSKKNYHNISALARAIADSEKSTIIPNLKRKLSGQNNLSEEEALEILSFFQKETQKTFLALKSNEFTDIMNVPWDSECKKCGYRFLSTHSEQNGCPNSGYCDGTKGDILKFS